jgi:hypothetical protein
MINDAEISRHVAWCAPGVTQVKNHICVGT